MTDQAPSWEEMVKESLAVMAVTDAMFKDSISVYEGLTPEQSKAIKATFWDQFE